MERRGDISSVQVIGILIALLGFVILLLFLWSAFGDNESLSKRQACKLSVLTRATAPTSAQSVIALRCSTDKICITNSEQCKEFFGQEGVSVVRLSGSDEDKARKIEEINANALYDCWDMMGRGKLDLFGQAHYTETRSRCVICSRVAISEEIAQNSGIMGLVNFNRYLVENNVPGQSRSYWDVIQDSSGAQTFTGVDFEQSRERVIEQAGVGAEEKIDEINDVSRGKTELVYVFAQQKTDLDWLEGAGLGARDSSIAIVGIHSAAGSIPLVGATLKTVLNSPHLLVLQALAVGGASIYSGVNSYQNQQASALYCGTFSSSSEENKEGCSLVRAVPYSAESINSICNVIEGDL